MRGEEARHLTLDRSASHVLAVTVLLALALEENASSNEKH